MCRVCRRCGAEATEIRFEVKSGSAAKDWHVITSPDGLLCLFRQFTVAGCIKRLHQCGHIKEMVRDASLLLRRGLGRADVHAAIHLHGIDSDDFSAEELRQLQGHLGLADGRRSGEKDRFQTLVAHARTLRRDAVP